MAFSSIVRALGRSSLSTELLTKLKTLSTLQLNGIPRLPKGLVASALAKSSERNLLVVCATLEEAGRWTTQLEAMGWKTIHFYPTSEASPYEPFDPETEMTWGQMQVLADLIKLSPESDNADSVAVVATQAALQPHLPPPEAFKPNCLSIAKGMEFNLGTFAQKMAALGYERVPLVEMEGTWSRRGDIVDVFPVSSELPVRLDWFGDEIEQIREFDPSTQRSALDKIDRLVLTPTSFAPILMSDAQFKASVDNYLSAPEKEQLESGQLLEGTRRFLGLAYEKPASLLDYLPENTLVAVDEVEQCVAHSLLWVQNAEEQWNGEGLDGEEGEEGEDNIDNNSPITNSQLPITNIQLPKIHRDW
ncbi:MAG: transcription-repair coupling factor, partial [Cyanobacteria bacterium J06649_11]